MEQRRYSGKNHWYHETQSSTLPQDVLPLVPEAAHVNDRFLLDLSLADVDLSPFQSWLLPARQLAFELFPAQVSQSRLHTFSAYERMSTALTVAQVYGVQRLCNHYAARLTPLPGPDSSRESNHRLAQITQYARQLASSPSIIDARARQQLSDVGLSIWDVVLINQIVGFVGFQARIVAIFQAWMGQPVRWIPGLDMQSFADVALFEQNDTVWQAYADGLEPPYANMDQNTNTVRLRSNVHLRSLASVLAHQPAILNLLERLLTSRLYARTPEHTFTALLTARINGSVSCFNEHCDKNTVFNPLRKSEREIESWERQHPDHRPLSQALQLLTRAPNRFSAAHFTPLHQHDASVCKTVHLLGWGALCGWLNRLKIALGETH